MPLRGGRAVAGKREGAGDPVVDGGDSPAGDAGYRRLGTGSRQAAAGDKGITLTTKGDLQTFSTVAARLAVGANGAVLKSDSTETTGLKWVAPTYTQAATPPTVNTAVTATGRRIVFGDCTLTPGAADAAIVNWQVEDAVASGVYVTVQTSRLGIGITAGGRDAYCFVVPAGRRYKWTAGGGATVAAETVTTYSYEES